LGIRPRRRRGLNVEANEEVGAILGEDFDSSTPLRQHDNALIRVPAQALLILWVAILVVTRIAVQDVFIAGFTAVQDVFIAGFTAVQDVFIAGFTAVKPFMTPTILFLSIHIIWLGYGMFVDLRRDEFFALLLATSISFICLSIAVHLKNVG